MGPGGAREVPPPPRVQGTHWWAQLLHTATAHLRGRLPNKPHTPMTHHSLLSGLCSEIEGFKAMQMLTKTELVVDMKVASQKFIQQHFESQCDHVYAKLEHVIAGGGYCSKHRRDCDVRSAPHMPHLATIGLPCQPFSSLRNHRVLKAPDHPLFEVTFNMFFEYLEKVQPLGFVAEQVIGFNRFNEEFQSTYLEMFLKGCADRGYSVRAVELQAGLWCDSERERRPLSMSHRL